jgi:hypothetical protein
MQSSHAEGRVMTKFIYLTALAIALGSGFFVQLSTYAEITSMAAVGGALTDAAPLF